MRISYIVRKSYLVRKGYLVRKRYLLKKKSYLERKSFLEKKSYSVRISRQSENFRKIREFSENLRISQKSENFQKIWEFPKIQEFSENQRISWQSESFQENKQIIYFLEVNLNFHREGGGGGVKEQDRHNFEWSSQWFSENICTCHPMCITVVQSTENLNSFHLQTTVRSINPKSEIKVVFNLSVFCGNALLLPNQTPETNDTNVF